MTPPVICIVGKSKSDKVRLMEGLIRELKTRGLRVGALKHHKHGDFEMDIEGKDTWKYARAGADTVAISSPTRLAVIKNVEGEMDIDEFCGRYFADSDIVLADGFALSDKPRIIVADTCEEIELFERGCEVVAVVGKAGMGDINGVKNKILSFLDKTGKTSSFSR
ncbi:MAG: molybdopterin-guanine dinucleotide biosynthesis protein B [Candidatus Methanoperedens sp.]|nr:molybdopterin-guanine dinucleotide biosynthesis protein B [Candidatus Methanoperedens sp.]